MCSGPYKRRTSSLYQQDQYPLQPLNHSSQPLTPAHQLLTHQSQSQPAQPYFNRPQLDHPLPDPITQAFAAAFDKPTWINGRRQSINPIQSQSTFQSSNNGQVYGYAAPPPPPISFQQTSNQHGHGEAPRQRIPSISTTHINTQIPKDERRGSMSSIFPISLHTLSGQDPFSRTVSPIGYKFSLPVSNLSNTTTATAGIGMDIDQPTTVTGDVDMEGINNDYSMSSITPPEINVVDFAYSNSVTQIQGDQERGQGQGQGQGMVYHSAPTSPRGTRMDTDINMGMGRASSAEPASSSTFLSLAQSGDPSQSLFPNQNQPTRTGMITPIPMPILGDRKPSLLTLMNSRPNTPSLTLPQQAHLQPLSDISPQQGTQGQESPTLFDGLPPISNHHPFDSTDMERERRMSYFGSMQLSSVPNAGGVGRLSLSKGSEGIGLGLGLEHVS
jgi:hypothetical protein